MTVDESETRTMALRRENETLKSSLEALEELVNHLKHMPEDVAKVTLQEMRAASNPNRVFQSIKGDTMGIRLSEHTTAKRILPPMQSGTEFELMLRSPISYPKIDRPEGRTSSKLPPLWKNRMPRMDCSLDATDPEKLPLTQSLQQIVEVAEESASTRETGLDEHSLKSRTKSCSDQNRFEMVTVYWDQRLENLNIAFWTTVPVTDQLAAGAISLYLETDYTITSMFNAHLFVGDLVGCRLQFCSPFMVSSLLSLACVS